MPNVMTGDKYGQVVVGNFRPIYCSSHNRNGPEFIPAKHYIRIRYEKV